MMRRKRAEEREGIGRGARRALLYLASPVGVLLVLFVGPMAVLLIVSFEYSSFTRTGGFTLSNYSTVLTDASYLRVAWTTIFVATMSMGVMLLAAIPLAYFLVFRLGKLELPILLLLVLSDELNPLIRIYAWRMLLGREGLINSFLTSLGVIEHPIDALLFSKIAVIIVLSASFIPYATIPIYASLKAIDPSLLEAADDLGSRWLAKFRKILLPLAAPGIFVTVILVYIPLFSEFAAPALVGGTSGYMLGNAVQEQVLELGDWGVGSAMSFLLLVLSGVVALIGYKLGRIRRLEAIT